MKVKKSRLGDPSTFPWIRQCLFKIWPPESSLYIKEVPQIRTSEFHVFQFVSWCSAIVADNYASVTQKSFRPYTTPSGKEPLPFHHPPNRQRLHSTEKRQHSDVPERWGKGRGQGWLVQNNNSTILFTLGVSVAIASVVLWSLLSLSVKGATGLICFSRSDVETDCPNFLTKIEIKQEEEPWMDCKAKVYTKCQHECCDVASNITDKIA